VQFVAGKETTQEELFHAFNELYLVRKQILLTSDRPPRDIPLLEDRLRSRFAGGMIADIQAPDETVRAAILRNKRDHGAFNVSNEVIDFIASQVKSSIREMEGVFLQVVSIGKTRGQEINLELATEVLSHNSMLSKKQIPTPKKVVEEVTTLFNISHKDLVGPRRTKDLVLPRQICMYLLRNTCQLPLMAVGTILGGRDHTTIMHGVQRIEEDIKEGVELVAQKVNLLNLKICG
jgi:chromosomal replication initiator protein